MDRFTHYQFRLKIYTVESYNCQMKLNVSTITLQALWFVLAANCLPAEHNNSPMHIPGLQFILGFLLWKNWGDH